MPLTVAGLGWVVVLVVPGPSTDGTDWVRVTTEAAGWALVVRGWSRLQASHPAYRRAWRTAAGAGIGSLVVLVPGPDDLALVLGLGYAGLTLLAMAAGARALVLAAGPAGGHLAAGQASFVCWAAVGALVAGTVGSLGTVMNASFTGLVLAAAQIGLALGVWFAALQLFSARRDYVRPRARR